MEESIKINFQTISVDLTKIITEQTTNITGMENRLMMMLSKQLGQNKLVPVRRGARHQS